MLKVQTLVELLQASTPYAPPGFEPSALYSTNSLVTSLLILGSLLLTLLLSTMAFFGNVLKQRSAQNVLRWRRDGAPVLARPQYPPHTHLNKHTHTGLCAPFITRGRTEEGRPRTPLCDFHYVLRAFDDYT